jgi:hypothetical protein
MYDNQTRSQLQTSQKFPTIGSQTKGIRQNKDGSYDIYFSPKPPKGYENNWLATVPGKGWFVAVKEASYSNSIGEPLLLAYWKDPDFDAQQKAFYYVWVIEIPTPRWTTYDAKFFGVALPNDVPASLQDRAYTSPIWYTPDPSMVKKAVSYPGLRDYLPE